MSTFRVKSNTQNDIFFKRMENGDILLSSVDSIDCVKIDGGIWGSLVLSMTKFGERPNDWHEFMDHHHGRADILEYAKKERIKNNDLPFLSTVAESAYQALISSGVDCTRDQFRPAIQAYIAAEEDSKRNYEEFRKKREQGLV